MRTYLAATAAAVLTCSLALSGQQPPAAGAAPAAPQAGGGRGQQGPQVVSPEVNADRTVTLRLYAPKAAQVTVTGELTNGATPPAMAKGDDGIWTITMPAVPPDVYTYAFNVDGVNKIVENPAPEMRICPKCGSEMTTVGHSVCEVLEIIPAQIIVVEPRDETVACPHDDVIVSAPTPPQIVEKGKLGTTLIVEAMADKYIEHQPIERQCTRFERQGVDLAPQTLGRGVAEFDAALRAGRGGIGRLTLFPPEGYRSAIAAEVRDAELPAALRERLPRGISRSVRLALIAAEEALAGARLPDEVRVRTGIAIGTTTGGMLTGEERYRVHAAGGSDDVDEVGRLG